MFGKASFWKNSKKLLIIAAISAGLWGCVQAQPTVAPSLSTDNTDTDTQAILAEQSPAVLQATDCVKCHTREPNDIKTHGGKHKTEVTCLDCHLEHLPSGVKRIPQCSMCHDPEDQTHFTLGTRKVCLGCHRNPHTPLDVTVDDTPFVSKGCKTCHPEKGVEFKKFPSKHSKKNCTFCHPRKHKQIKKCLQCHKPHAKFLVFKDCLRCHKPHSPLNIRYADDIPNKYCGACHTDIFKMLSKSKAKHGTFKCAFCHKNKHPTVPNCRDCHGSPHDSSILKPFNSQCLKCHRNPHDLIF